MFDMTFQSGSANGKHELKRSDYRCWMHVYLKSLRCLNRFFSGIRMIKGAVYSKCDIGFIQQCQPRNIFAQISGIRHKGYSLAQFISCSVGDMAPLLQKNQQPTVIDLIDFETRALNILSLSTRMQTQPHAKFFLDQWQHIFCSLEYTPSSG